HAHGERARARPRASETCSGSGIWRASSIGPHLRVRDSRARGVRCSTGPSRPASGAGPSRPASDTGAGPERSGGGMKLSAGRGPDTIARMPVSVSAPRGLGGLVRPLRLLIARVLRRERRRAGEIAVVLTDDALLRQINRDWRGIDRATDVISFAYDEREPDAHRLPVRGDLLVSLDRVRDQARRYRVSPGRELARLVTHGTLHLCGHDHARPAERSRMRARESAALRVASASVRELDRGLAGRDGARPRRPRRSAAG